ncbi:MAG: hypothetical protein HFE49_07835 [Clostridia bacterium]|nr:hypothetical protein [Clostridia bacterium]
MGDTKTEMLTAAKMLLGIEDEKNDELLLFLIDDTESAVKAYCRLDVLPRQLVSLIPTLTANRYRLNMHEDIKSVTEGERRVEYSDRNYDWLSGYAARLKPFVSRNVKLPSDLAVKEDDNDQSL